MSTNKRGDGLFKPPAGKAPAQRRDVGKKGDPKKKGKNKNTDTEAHAKEVREITRGKDIVDRPVAAELRERRPAAFNRIDMIVVRTWLRNRPLEPPISATAMVAFPRMWTTKRGRYCKFNAPGAGAYGLVRARPSF
ncbi:MAG: hypothetical protein ACAI38_00990 [Myxococcota bacterium]